MRTPILLLAALLPACTGRDSAAPPKAETALFNGRDLAGWTWVLEDPKTAPDQVWSVAEGVILCHGVPKGYLRTVEEYRDYELTLEWRWKPGTQGGNSGVLLHASAPSSLKPWPRCIEAQLKAGSAGDLVEIGETIQVRDKAARQQGIVIANLVDDAEGPPGEWNTMTAVCRGDEITIHVNGKLANHGTGASATGGAICLQSEGAEIHFRNLRIKPARETNP